jgi:hypothetical protein
MYLYIYLFVTNCIWAFARWQCINNRVFQSIDSTSKVYERKWRNICVVCCLFCLVGLRLSDRSSIPGKGEILVPCPQRLHEFWGPPSVVSNEYQESLSLGVKRPGREADHVLQTGAEVGSIHPLPHTSSWRCAYLIKHKDNFVINTLNVYFIVNVDTLSSTGKNSWLQIQGSGFDSQRYQIL